MAHLILILVTLSSLSHILAADVIRDSRSIGSSISGESKLSSELNSGKTIQRLVGGHVKNSNENAEILFMESAGDKSKDKRKDDDDDEKKTLSQQVADGKYGLIQKEIFAKPPKSQGIISYNKNPEVPKDTKKNLGGLEPSDIWLAEDHLLVLKGGLFPEHDSKDDVPPNWPPIDDFKAPRRQVTIPKHPKIPPPFPVQLHDNGPIEFLGVNGSAPRPLPQNYGPPYPQHGFVPGSGPFFPQSPAEFNFTGNGDTPFPLPPYGGGYAAQQPGNGTPGNGGPAPFPYLPPGQVNRGKPGQQLPPFIASLPPGAVYLPPPQNKTELYDEDDPSIYYPPPYSFFYPKDNSSKVPAGPLVPGIILPPPPDFFAPENGETTTELPPTTSETYTQIYPTQTPKPETSSKSVYKPPILHQITKPIYVSNNLDSPEKIRLSIPTSGISDEPDNNLLSLTTPSTPIQTPTPTKSTLKQTLPIDTNYYYTTEPGISVATFNLNSATPPKKTKTFRPTVPTTSINYDYPENNYYENNAVSPNPRPFSPYETEKQRSRYNSGRTIVSTTAIPLKAYFTTPVIEANPISSDPLLYYQQRQGSLATRQSPKIKSQAAYYYYEEDSKSTTPATQYSEYYEAANLKQTSPQYFPQSDDPNPQNRQQYYIVAAKNNGRNNGQYYTTPRQRYPLYDTTLRPQLINSQLQQLRQELQSYLSSTRFKSTFEQTTPKPVYEYSFQSADYAQKNFRNQQSNDDPFRPIVGYNPAYQTTPNPFTYDKPVKNNYYSTPNPRFEYPESATISPIRQGSQRQNYQGTFLNVRPTPNPIDHAYYTKQEEGLLDDITKQYFTVFGQKIADAKDLGITIPIRNIASTTVRPVQADSDEQYIDPALQNVQNVESIEVHFGDNTQSVPNERRKPISLASDTLVNYRNPRPKINPNSEFIPIVNPHSQYTQNQLNHEQVISLESDIDVNNKFPRPPLNPDAEVFTPIKVNGNAESLEQHNYYPASIETLNRPNNGKIISNTYIQQHPLNAPNRNVAYQTPLHQQDNQKIRNGAGEGQPGSFISYKLPGNGAHFYFLTPQAVLAKQKQEITSGYLFQEPNQRLRRSRVRQKDGHAGGNNGR